MLIAAVNGVRFAFNTILINQVTITLDNTLVGSRLTLFVPESEKQKIERKYNHNPTEIIKNVLIPELAKVISDCVMSRRAVNLDAVLANYTTFDVKISELGAQKAVSQVTNKGVNHQQQVVTSIIVDYGMLFCYSEYEVAYTQKGLIISLKNHGETKSRTVEIVMKPEVGRNFDVRLLKDYLLTLIYSAQGKTLALTTIEKMFIKLGIPANMFEVTIKR